MSEFGPIIDYGRVEDAIRDGVIRTWIDTYLVAVERENNLPPRTITRPRDWKILDDLTLISEKNLPVVYVISAGDQAELADDGDGALSGLLSMGVLIAAKDTNRDTTRSLARRYGAAVATLVQHKLGLAGLGVRLASKPRQNFDERANFSRGQSNVFIMALAYVTFDVQVDVVRYSRGGPDDPFPEPETPRDPDAPPNPQDPDHLTTNVDVDVVEGV